MSESIKNQFVNSIFNNPLFNYEGKKIPKHLGNLPFPPELFLGREDDMIQVHRKLFGSENILLLVNGEGGIGKTTFASKYYHRYAEEYSHMAWIFAEKGLSEALLVLARPLQVSFTETMGTDARLEKLFKEMAGLDKPCLLVVDNANCLIDLKKNFPALRSCPNFHVLLTTRITELSNASFHPLGALGREDARELFCKHYTVHESQEDILLDQLLKAIGYNTLVIELLAKNLGQFNNKLKKRYPLYQMLTDLTEKGLFGIPSQPVVTGYQVRNLNMRTETPEAIIGAMYDIGELQREEQTILSLLSVLPAERIGYVVLEEILSEMKELDTLLLALSTKGWLDFNQENSDFRISPVIQEAIRWKREDILWDDCQHLIRILNHKLNYETDSGHLINIDYGEAILWVNYSEFAGNTLLPWFNKHQPRDEGLAWLFDGLGYFYRTYGDLHKALLNFQTSGMLFKKLKISFPKNVAFQNGLINSYERLGETYNMLGNLEKALMYFELYNKLEQENSSSHPQNIFFIHSLAISYSKLGNIHTSLGNVPKALKYYEHYNKLEKKLYGTYPQNEIFKNSLAISYSKLGDTISSMGNIKKALTYFEEHSQIAEELYSSNPQNVAFKHGLAISYERLGTTQRSLGNLEKALEYYERQNNFEQELSIKHPQNLSFKNGLAISYSKLGDTQSSLGNIKKALKYFEEHSHIAEELYSSNPQNVTFKQTLAISYERLGNTHRSLGSMEKALGYFEQYNNLEQEFNSSYPHSISFKKELAISYSKLGDTQLSLGNIHKALEYFEEDSKISKDMHNSDPQNVEFKNGLIISYSKLGDTQLSLGNPEKALGYFEKSSSGAKELYKSNPQNAAFKSGLAITYERLGTTLSTLGDLKKALWYFKERLILGKELFNYDPKNVESKTNLAISYQLLGKFYEKDLKNTEKAKDYYIQAKSLLAELNVAFPAIVEFKTRVNWIEDALKRIE
ncbi:tetratricopeptide repeat protein [Cyclobacterium amurskyense]|uniref:tetratricopeptide repeat protein n=1 Tax=Cyclobacterium amurskyense TaxID=320787 RepID=UPI0030DA7FBE